VADRGTCVQPVYRFDEAVRHKIVSSRDTSPLSVEQYRRLAATLHGLQVSSGLRTVMVSSALPRDGKTLTTTNLALTLSESYGRRVLLIDADLRRPSIHEVFGLDNKTGLAEGLGTDASGSLPVTEVSPTLTVLTAGTPDRRPMAGLTSERMAAILKEAASRFDWVLLDTPPIGLISDAQLLAALVDGVVLVVGAGSTDHAAVAKTVQTLGRERIIGVVLNRVEEEQLSQGSHYENYYLPSGSSSSELRG
jgi:capsular exopolysaccharide synthesis family protein